MHRMNAATGRAQPNMADAKVRLLKGDLLELDVLRFQGDEALGRLFRFAIDVAIPAELADNFDENRVIGEQAALLLQTEKLATRTIRGMVSDCSFLNIGRKHLYFRLVLSPMVWPLTQRRNARIFQERTTPQIIEAVLADHGLAHRGLLFALKEEYGERDYCVQYRESDWSFIQRLMEEEGMYHFYRVRDDEAILQITDGPHGHLDLQFGREVRFHAPEGMAPDSGTVHELSARRRVRPGRVTQTDYANRNPGIALETSEIIDPMGAEVFDYPGRYRDSRLGQRLTRVRAQELQTGSERARGRSTRFDFAAGRTLDLEGHPLGRLNRDFTVVRVRHRGVTPMAAEVGYLGHEGQSLTRPAYENEFTVIPASRPFRPRRRTRCPVVGGPQTAVVVGPEKEEIHTDRFGRVKVRFHWDREHQLQKDRRRKSDASCWIRVSQPWAGRDFGGMAIPRVGQEVIVDFLEGDPNQPIITGRVFNGDKMPPQDLPARKARTSIRSNSYPGGGGFNEITMDDTARTEHFYMKAQHDKTEEIGNNRSTSVGVDSTEVVGNNVSESVGNNMSTDVKNACNTTCDTMLINAKTSITLQCGASRIHMNQAGFISITGTVITSAATVNNSMVAPMTEVVGAVMLTQAGAVVLVEGGATHVRGELLAALKGGKVNVVADGDNIVQGGTVKIN